MPYRGDAGWRLRSAHLLLNGLLFSLCYTLANALARQAHAEAGVALPFERWTPFVPWLAIPYMSSGPLLIAGFYFTPGAAQLRALSRRLLLATLAGCVLFALLPLRYDGVRPPISEAVPAALFAWLDALDQPYNQLPSLHVAYCVICWHALRERLRGGARAALALWLLAVAASAVLTWQHRLADVAGGLLLGWLAVRLIVPGQPARLVVAQHYALAALLAFLLLNLAHPGQPWWNAAGAWLSASLLLVALAYARGRHHFPGKRGGRHPLRSWLLYAPYLAGYLLTWQLVRWRERHRPPFILWGDGLWVGRWLDAGEAARLPPGCAVIDLANELAETPALRPAAGRHYHHFPLLDLARPEPRVTRQILAAMREHAVHGRPIYLHCAMGYQRSRALARLYCDAYPLMQAPT